MTEMVSGFEDMYIVIYCLLILWVNISYLREQDSLNKEMNELPDDEELLFNPHHFSIAIMGLTFNFFRRWLIYLLAVIMTESVIVLVISVILFIASLYDTLFNYTLAKMKKARIGLYVIRADVVYIIVFIVYILMKM